MPATQLDQALLKEYQGHVIGAEQCKACCCQHPGTCECGGRIHGDIADLGYEGDAIHDTECDKCHKKFVYEDGTGPEFTFVTPERKAELLELVRHDFSPASNIFPSGPREVEEGPNGAITVRQPMAQFYEIGGPSCKHCGGRDVDIHKPKAAAT